ncbi:MAG: hypothetical protein WCB53_15085 [Terriglobales bacterium]
MRFFVAVMAVVLAVGANGLAQNGSGNASAKNEPKSTVPMKAAGPHSAGTSGSSSKELQKVENEKVAKDDHAKKTHVRTVRATKERNSAINFNGRGSKGTGMSSRSGGSLKGRLKQKGQGKQH